jgi:hypothetical protein
MDQSEFQDLLKGLCSGDSSSVLKAATSLHKLTVTKEIQDFDWTSSLYDSIWRALLDCWLKASSILIKVDVLQIWRIEKLLVDTFCIIIGFPEFELETAAESQFVRIEMLQALFKRVLTASQSLLSVQRCLHWIYQNRLDLRSAIRIMLCSTLLAETTLDPSMKKGRYKDGGRGRDHVGPMLEVLLCIVEGFTLCPRASCKALLMNVLMPLHQPNEMVEWRDQIPVLQLYHRQLLRCVQAVIEKSRASHNTEAASTSPGCSVVSNQQQESLLVTAVRGLLSFWPPSHSANTPKEILMMHELEGLVLMATVTRSSSISSMRTGASEFLAVLPLFLKKVASALGKVGDSDNFRTSQRALQTFKSKALLLLLAEQHRVDKEIEEKRELEDGGNATVASSALSSVFSALIPALYRGGQLSWNPTVNKMTALALRNLMALDEGLFRKCCDSCLSTPLDGASCSISDSNSDSAVRTGEAQGHSLGTGKGLSAADAAGGDMSLADNCVGHASRLSLDSDPEGQHGHGPPSQTHLNKKMRPPLPVQDAIFAPASAAGSKAIPPCFQAQMCPQSLSSMMQQSTAGKVEGFHALKA